MCGRDLRSRQRDVLFSPQCPNAKRNIKDLARHSDAFITLPAFTQYLNVPDKMVRKWIRAGVLPVYCFVGEWRIKTTDAIAFVERERLR